jgi:hypothetical protein
MFSDFQQKQEKNIIFTKIIYFHITVMKTVHGLDTINNFNWKNFSVENYIIFI